MQPQATTVGVKLDQPTRDRLKRVAHAAERTPHWLIKSALLEYLDSAERALEEGRAVPLPGSFFEEVEAAAPEDVQHEPFVEFAHEVQPQSVLRAAITAAYRRPEPECLPLLIEQARLTPQQREQARSLARKLTEGLRHQRKQGAVEALIQEFSLSSQEGVALMCLAEALLRIPDTATRDSLIRDKIGRGDWRAHIGHSRSLFVNAASWGLMIGGKLVSTLSERGLAGALDRLLATGGEPLVRKGVDLAMRLLGEHFVTGETIAEALANGRAREARGYSFSFDMLGEAAMTADDAERYYVSYEQAIHAIGRASAGRGIYAGPGISIKLSALHPRYARAQRERVMAELLPRVKSLLALCRQYDIGLNIDAEEADRLEISLDLLEALALDRDFAGWNGLGFVVQAYQKRAPFVLDWLIDLGRRARRRLMVRLVKGAYWDSEIKRAQLDGLEGYPVYTRKMHTDVAYMACARKLLAAPEAIYPQFATHNAYTLAAIHAMAGQNYYPGQYEFQCLHGMGEPLYDQVTGPDRLNRPCRIYAPVGSHETLLAYLVRRLLENGANTSFVNRINDETLDIDDLIADPVEQSAAVQPFAGAPHALIPLPSELFGDDRINSAGLDLSNEQRLASLAAGLMAGAVRPWLAAPVVGEAVQADGRRANVLNPADERDIVGQVIEADTATVERAVALAQAAAGIWQATPVEERAACLERASHLFEAEMPALIGLAVREAGKTYANAVGEVREAVDFLRYYAAEIRRGFANDTHRPLGVVACISPWNFPLAIFTGQVAAALAAGNTVLAKPAEQTPLIAAHAVALLRQAGLPAGVLQFLPGRGETVGAALTAAPAVRAVIFTGSTDVARLIQRTLAERGGEARLIAETGGQNAMIVDSSALPEQVTVDVLASAFDSAGQRCSALRLLCLQEDVADRMLAMIKGAMRELKIGAPEILATDVGPVIDAEARRGIVQHIEAMRAAGRPVFQTAPDEPLRHGTFVPPTLIEIDDAGSLQREIFGPVLHVLRYPRAGLDRLVQSLNGLGYGLTMGIHSRIDETIDRVTTAARIGNVYVNRNIIGAVVGVQPFGGQGLSGTGPKAGGPVYLHALLERTPGPVLQSGSPTPAVAELRQWVAGGAGGLVTGDDLALVAAAAEDFARRAPTAPAVALPSPTGERNLYSLVSRGRVLVIAEGNRRLLIALAAVLATGGRPVLPKGPAGDTVVAALPATLRDVVARGTADDAEIDAVLFAGDADHLAALRRQLAGRAGIIVPVVTEAELTQGIGLERLMVERSLSVNTAAAGGNASLMTIG